MKEIHDDVNSSLFWSEMADETTDSSVTEQLILYVQFVNIAKKMCPNMILGCRIFRRASKFRKYF